MVTKETKEAKETKETEETKDCYYDRAHGTCLQVGGEGVGAK